jgi:phosphatidate cytidylyltransferase
MEVVVERIVSGIVALLLVVPAIVWGGEIGAELVVALVVVVGLDEWTRMTQKESYRRAFPVLLVMGFVLYSCLVWSDPSWIAPAMGASAIAILCYGLFAVPDTKDGARQVNTMLTGLVYVPGLLCFVPWIRSDLGLDWLFMMLIVTWCGDTGAYFAGRSLGRRKLFERISPKKTWEGAIGGLILSVVGALVVRAVDPGISPGGLERVPWHHIAVLGGLIHVSGVIGDLVESLFKRAHGIKDSGWIMPGHGGILDRVDSILFTAPVTWIYATFFSLG